MKDPADGVQMVEMSLGRIVIREGADHQYIYLKEKGGERGFPIVIGSSEAWEIQRVVTKVETERPLTHQLTYDIVERLGANLTRVDIVDLSSNTFFARLLLSDSSDELCATVDARPSDAIALALRARCPVHVSLDVLESVRTDTSGPDPLPEVDREDPSDLGDLEGPGDPTDPEL